MPPLRNVDDAGLGNRMGASSDEVLSAESDRAAYFGYESRDAAQQRALASAVRLQRGDRLATGDRQ